MRGLLIKLTERCGVNIVDPENTWIAPEIAIGRGTIIYPNCYLVGDTNSSIGEDCEIGPNAYLGREWFNVGDKVKIGFNAELVRSAIGNGTKVPHFCHVGDALIGQNCNIAAGVIFCNFDGNKKQHITIGDYVFVGSGAKLIAPVKIADHAYIGAGAIVSKDVEPYNLIVGVNKFVKEKRSFCWSKNHEQLPDNVHIDQPEDGWHIYPIDEHPVYKARGGY